MANWLSENPEAAKTVFQGLAADLIAKDLASNPRELSEEENQALGLTLTVAYQDEKGLDYDHSELVVKYGTPEELASYRAFTENN